MNQSPSIKLLDEKLLPANYAANKNIQKVNTLIRNINKTVVTQLPAPWRKSSNRFR